MANKLTNADEDLMNELISNSTKTSLNTLNKVLLDYFLDNITRDQIKELLADKNRPLYRICEYKSRHDTLSEKDFNTLENLYFQNKLRKANIDKILLWFFIVANDTSINTYNSNYNSSSENDFNGGTKNKRKIHVGKNGGKYYVKKGKKIYVK